MVSVTNVDKLGEARAVITPASFIMHSVFESWKQNLLPTEATAIFTPGLEYVEAVTGYLSLRIVGGEVPKPKAKAPILCYNRGPMTWLDESENRRLFRTFFKGTDSNGNNRNIDLRGNIVQFSMNFRVFFQDVSEMELFEALYMTRLGMSADDNVTVDYPFLTDPLIYTTIIEDLKDIEIRGKQGDESQYVSISGSILLTGPVITYVGERANIEQIILTVRDYYNTSIIYDTYYIPPDPTP